MRKRASSKGIKGHLYLEDLTHQPTLSELLVFKSLQALLVFTANASPFCSHSRLLSLSNNGKDHSQRCRHQSLLRPGLDVFRRRGLRALLHRQHRPWCLAVHFCDRGSLLLGQELSDRH